MEKIIEGLLWYAVFLFSTTVHEAAHALTSYRLGDRTAYEGGQVSINPMPHIRREPVGTVIFPVISFLLGGWMIGWASAPYDPAWATRFPRRSAMMSLAGPLANLLLVLIAAALIKVGIASGVFYAPDSINYSRIIVATNGGVLDGLAAVLSIFFSLNLILLIFNLLPLPPLDGSGVAPVLLDEGSARKYMEIVNHPAFALVGLLIAWQVFGVIFDPIHLLAINLLFPGAGYQ